VDFGIQVYNLNFIKLFNIDGNGFTEDFVLGQTAILFFGKALTPNFKNYLYNKVGVTFSQGLRFWESLFYMTYQRQVWFRSENNVRQLNSLTGHYYNQKFDFLTFALRGSYLSDKRSEHADDLIIGGSSGIRGYEKYFRTGNRRVIFNAETRFFSGIEILSTTFDPAAYIDAGRTWKSDQDLTFRDFYFSAGVGLRIGFGHTSRSKMTRIDLSYSETNGWQISVGTDQYFSAKAASFFLTTH
jgi:hypothetical protein